MDSKVARRLRENALVKSLNGNTIAKEPETSKVTRSLAMILEYSKDCSHAIFLRLMPRRIAD